MTRLRVTITRPKSETCSAFDGARSLRSSCSTAWNTFWRFFFSSMSMKSQHDDAAEVAQPDLPHDLLRRFEVGLDDRVFEPAGGLLADVAAGVDVDRDQRLGLVDDDRAARLQPHLAAQRLVELGLHAVLLEDREVLVVAASRAAPASGMMRPMNSSDALVLERVVDADRRVVVGQQIAQQLGDQARLLIDRRPASARCSPRCRMSVQILVEVLQVGEDVFLRAARRPRCG